MRWTAAVVGVSLSAIISGSSAVAEAEVPCERLLTATEVEAAAGAGFNNLGNEASDGGKSQCIWLLDRTPNPKAIAVTFWPRSAVPAAEQAGLFEKQATKAEGLHLNKREVLQGIGAKAALVPGKKPGAMMVLIIETKDGLAYVETDYVERAQALLLAKAIAAP